MWMKEQVQGVRAITAFAEFLDSIIAATWQLTTMCNSSFRDQRPFSGLYRDQAHKWSPDIYASKAHKHTKMTSIKKK